MAALAAAAGPAGAQQGSGWTAPAYPGNTMTIQQAETVVAGTVAKVKLSGHAEWNQPTDEFTSPYDVYLYVQNADVTPTCAPSYRSQLQATINLNLNAADAISGWVVDSDLHAQPAPPASGSDWSSDSLPFSVKPGLAHVVLCGYVRNIIDDVAGFQLPLRVQQPQCRARRGTVRKGVALRLRCNFSGAVTVRLRGAVTRSVPVRLSDGRATLSTRRLRPGSYRVSVSAGERRLGRAFRVRVR